MVANNGAKECVCDGVSLISSLHCLARFNVLFVEEREGDTKRGEDKG